MRATRGASSATSARAGRRPQTRNQPAVYEDFTPLIENLQDESSHIVLIHLPGFMKNQLRILAESNRRILRVRGERLVLGNKWARFQEEIPVPHHCQITEIRAKFERGILRVTMPRRMPAAVVNDQPLPSPQSVVRRPSPPPPQPLPSPPQQLEELEHVSPPRLLPQQPPVVLPPLVRTPSPPPPSLKPPEPPVLPPRSPQIPQSKLLRADDHDRYHDAPANVTLEKQAVYEEPKASPPRIVLRPRPTGDGEQQQQGTPTIFDNSSADQEDHHHIPQPKSQPLSDHHEDVYLTQLEQLLLADSHRPMQYGALNAGGGGGIPNGGAAAVHEEMMMRRRHVQQGVEDKGFDKASVTASKLKENGDARVGGLRYRNGWKRMLTEERQLAVNAGVAILVAFSLGAYVSYLLFPEKSNN